MLLNVVDVEPGGSAVCTHDLDLDLPTTWYLSLEGVSYACVHYTGTAVHLPALERYICVHMHVMYLSKYRTLSVHNGTAVDGYPVLVGTSSYICAKYRSDI